MEKSIVDQLTEKVEALIADSALFLVEIKNTAANNIKIFIDGDAGVTIEAVSKINRALYRQLEEEEFLNGDFSLEVSSPGVDEPLRFLRQYNKNIGRKVEVTLNEGEPAVLEGVLKIATEAEITIEETIGKKKEKKETVIPFSNIKKTVVQISF
jgi:ribosome maturation factor RimP